MAKLIAHGNELFRYWSPKLRGVVAVMSDGTSLLKTPYAGWKLWARKKAEVPMEQWLAGKRKRVDELPEAWMKTCASVPSFSTLQRWEKDGVCKTPTGHRVEPDGVGPDGVPSWLRILGII